MLGSFSAAFAQKSTNPGLVILKCLQVWEILTSDEAPVNLFFAVPTIYAKVTFPYSTMSICWSFSVYPNWIIQCFSSAGGASQGGWDGGGGYCDCFDQQPQALCKVKHLSLTEENLI